MLWFDFLGNVFLLLAFGWVAVNSQYRTVISAGSFHGQGWHHVIIAVCENINVAFIP